jgi:hypothetical protein
VAVKIKIKIVGEEKSRVIYSKSRHLLTTEEKENTSQLGFPNFRAKVRGGYC